MASDIHEELTRRADVLLKEVGKLWDGKSFQDVAFTWAGARIKDDEGVEVNDLVGCDLPDGNNSYRDTLLGMAVRTQACAAMLVKKEGDTITAVFETPEGSKSWIYPIELHGDVRVIGQPKIRTDTECLGLLWKRGMGES